ncbi:hypothetical protein ACWGI0_14750 [Streptomyces sp. NPDC054802]
MKHASNKPTSYRGPFSSNWLKPRGHRTFLLGIGASVVGFAGAVRRVLEGSGILPVLGFFAAGVLGVTLTVAWIVTYAKEH